MTVSWLAWTSATQAYIDQGRLAILEILDTLLLRDAKALLDELTP
jgi:hypothetical protein